MTSSHISDARQRSDALDISRSFCVQAPAGSGKTELLTQRFLKLLLVSERPEDILAFTFTRKAAFEMRQRIVQSLRQDEAEKMTEKTRELAQLVLERDQELQWNLPANPQRLKIVTIDSFNSSICAQLPVLSGLGGQVEILEDPGPIYQEAIRKLFGRLEESGELADALTIFLGHLDNHLGRAEGLLFSLLQKRDQWLSHIFRLQQEDELKQELTHNLQEVITEALSNALTALGPYRQDIMGLLNFAAANLEKESSDVLSRFNFTDNLPATDLSGLDAWRAIADFFLTQQGQFRKTVDIRNGFPAKNAGSNADERQLFESSKNAFKNLVDSWQEKPELLAVLRDLRILPAAEYREDEWSFLNALANILIALVGELNLLFNQYNQADYIHISASALQALSHDESISDLVLRLDYRIKHILVDEFQDTSHLQIELLRRLTHGWQLDDGRTLFIVGDGMQSCYGFRNADVGLFLKARDQGIGSIQFQGLQLKMNFRSTRALVAWVNRIFSKSFPAQDNISRGAVSYSPGEAVNSETTEAVTTSLLVHPAEEKIDRELALQQEASLLIHQLNSLDSADSSSVAILVNTRSHLRAIIPALRQANIHWIASDIDPLSSFAVIKDLLSLLQALNNQADISSLYALLRSPFVGLGLKDIHQLKRHADRHELSLWQSLLDYREQPELSDDACSRLQRVVPVLQQARQSRGWSPLPDWLENCWLHLGGPACLDGAHELLYVERFLTLLATECEGMEIIDIHRLRRLCDTTYLGSNQDTGSFLQIMTIHKAKGLEFDYVLIPGLERSPRSNERELFLWQEQSSTGREARLLLAPLHARGDDSNPTYEYLRNESEIRNRLENTRLLYIAITRARKQAMLFAQVQPDKSGAFKKPAESSLLATIWPALSENPDMLKLIPLQQPETDARTSTPDKLKIRRLSASWKLPARMPEPERQKSNSTADTEPRFLIARKTGDLIHEALRLHVEKKLDVLAPAQRKKYRDYWQSRLVPVCSDKASLNSALQRIEDNLTHCMQHEKAGWLFDTAHEAGACELRISDYRKQWRKEHIVDRTFIDDGVRWIIDYKSSELEPRQNLDDFLKQQRSLYQAQLARYAELFQQMAAEPVKVALFFTALPYWLEISL